MQDFLVEGSSKSLGVSDFRGSEQNFILGKAVKFKLNFQKCVKIIKNMKNYWENLRKKCIFKNFYFSLDIMGKMKIMQMKIMRAPNLNKFQGIYRTTLSRIGKIILTFQKFEEIIAQILKISE